MKLTIKYSVCMSLAGYLFFRSGGEVREGSSCWEKELTSLWTNFPNMIKKMTNFYILRKVVPICLFLCRSSTQHLGQLLKATHIHPPLSWFDNSFLNLLCHFSLSSNLFLKHDKTKTSWRILVILFIAALHISLYWASDMTEQNSNIVQVQVQVQVSCHTRITV